MKIGPIQPPKVRLPEQPVRQTKTPEAGRSGDLDRFESAKGSEVALAHLLGETQRAQVSDGQKGGGALAARANEAAGRFQSAPGKSQEGLRGMKTVSIAEAVAATAAAVVVATVAFGAAGLAAGALVAAGGLTGGLEGSRVGLGNPFDPELAAELRKGTAHQRSAVSVAEATSSFASALDHVRKGLRP